MTKLVEWPVVERRPALVKVLYLFGGREGGRDEVRGGSRVWEGLWVSGVDG
jgi:hypothetical protein